MNRKKDDLPCLCESAEVEVGKCTSYLIEEEGKKGDNGSPGILVNVRRLNVVQGVRKGERRAQWERLAIPLVCGRSFLMLEEEWLSG